MDNVIKRMSLEQIQDLLESYGEPSYRAKQLFEWLHSHNVQNYDEMTNLPKSLRQRLSKDYPLFQNSASNTQESEDGSRKYIMDLADGNSVETVGIVNDDDGNRITVCFSSQVGCPVNCTFCATGGLGFVRNLAADEMVSQIVMVERDFDKRVNNVVAMGQGEPFLNYKELISALHEINSPDGLGIGARQITVSTSGIPDGIIRFSNEPEQFRLAVSLHSAIQETRDQLMPNLKSQPLTELKDALIEYEARKGRRITIEYLLLDGVNDSSRYLNALYDFVSDLNAHVNLLSYNQIEGMGYKGSNASRIGEWNNKLNKMGIRSSIRKSKGSDIHGACGQLAANAQN